MFKSYLKIEFFALYPINIPRSDVVRYQLHIKKINTSPL